MADLARVALIDGALRKVFCDEDESYREFLDNHNAEASPYEHCNDNVCRHARRQADDVLDCLKKAGFVLMRVIPEVDREHHFNGDEADEVWVDKP